MNNTAYTGAAPGGVPGPLSVFQGVTTTTSVAGVHHTTLQEAIMSRIRPFGLSASDLKDLPPGSFPHAGLGLVRPDGFPHLPLFSHMQNGFLPPSLSASGAFRPIFSALPADTPILKSFPSAFQPPSSRSEKGSPCSLFSPGHNLFPRLSPSSSRSSPSPLNPSGIGSLGKPDENSNTEPASVRMSSPDIKSDEQDEEDRYAKRMRMGGVFGCPVCGVGISKQDLEAHYTQELDYLSKLTLGTVRDIKPPDFSVSRFSCSPSVETAPRSRWESYQRIQRNRQSRIRVKLCRRAGKRQDEVLEEEVGHAEDDIDIVGEESQGAKEDKKHDEKYQGLYGPQQYTEEDIQIFKKEISAPADEERVVKEAVHEEVGEPREVEEDQAGEDAVKVEQEGHRGREGRKIICSTCQGELNEAVVSLRCWHVMCRLCWFKQLAEENQCPRCSVECQPKDLRKIYL